MRVQPFVITKSDGLKNHPVYTKEYLTNKPWVIKISNKQQFDKASSQISDIIKFQNTSHTRDTTRFGNVYVDGARSNQRLLRGSGDMEPEDVREVLPVLFDEFNNPYFKDTVRVKEIISEKEKALLEKIKDIEKIINDSEEVILKMLTKRSELINIVAESINSKDTL